MTALSNTILVVDDTPTNLQLLLDTLEDAGYKALVATDGHEALERAVVGQIDLILLDVVMPGLNGFEVCQRLKQTPELQDIPVIFMTALSETEDKVKAFTVGGVDYIAKPFQEAEVLARVKTHLMLRHLHQTLQQQNELLQREIEAHHRTQATASYLREEIESGYQFEDIIGNSPALKNCLERVSQVATTDTSVLILGESGTGKELIARALHHHSPRRTQPLVKVNCAALPRELLESELFGHEKGAFTGALQRRQGRFELADGGTIFLDEIGELPAAAQVGLLRVLQEQEFERVGGQKTLHVDVRIVAATNRDLEAMVKTGEFRLDLFYRLNVFPIEVPPLRERRDDIPLLVRAMLDRLSKQFGKPLREVSAQGMDFLLNYHWPGNIRELQNIIERAAVIANDSMVDIDKLPSTTEIPPSATSEQAFTPCSLAAAEHHHIVATLEHTGWAIAGKQGAAELLDLPPSTLRSRMQKLGIKRK